MRQAMKVSIGPSLISWQQLAAMIFLGMFTGGSLDYLAFFVNKHGASEPGCWYFLLNGVQNGVAYFASIESITWMTRRCIHLSGWKQCAWTILCTFVGIITAFVLQAIAQLLLVTFTAFELLGGDGLAFFRDPSIKEGTEGAQVAFVMYVLATVVIAIVLCLRPWGRSNCQQNLEAEEQTRPKALPNFRSQKSRDNYENQVSEPVPEEIGQPKGGSAVSLWLSGPVSEEIEQPKVLPCKICRVERVSL